MIFLGKPRRSKRDRVSSPRHVVFSVPRYFHVVVLNEQNNSDGLISLLHNGKDKRKRHNSTSTDHITFLKIKARYMARLSLTVGPGQ